MGNKHDARRRSGRIRFKKRICPKTTTTKTIEHTDSVENTLPGPLASHRKLTTSNIQLSTNLDASAETRPRTKFLCQWIWTGMKYHRKKFEAKIKKCYRFMDRRNFANILVLETIIRDRQFFFQIFFLTYFIPFMW